MPNASRRLPRWVWGAACVLPVLLMLPLFLAAFSAFPVADDFVYAVRTHAEWQRSGSLPHVLVDALRYAGQIYRTWQGTFTGALVMALNPLVFSWRLYPLHAVLLLLFSLFSFWVLIRSLGRHLYRGEPRHSLPSALMLWALFFLLMPDLREGLYWFNSAWFYTGTQCLLHLVVALCLSLPDLSGPRRGLGFGLLCLLLLWIGLNNYVTAVLAVCLMALFALGAFLRRRARVEKIGFLLAFGVVLAALMVSVGAPGNQMRMETDRIESGMMGLGFAQALLQAMGQSFVVAGRHLFATPLWIAALLLLVLGALHGPMPGLRLRHIALLPLLCWALLVAMLFPHLYTSGNIGAARVVNVYDSFILLATLGCAFLLGGGLRVLLSGMQIRPRVGIAAALVLVSLLSWLVAFALPSSYRVLLREGLGGTLTEYRREMTAQFETLEAHAPSQEPLRLAPPERIPSMAFELLTGDPDQWRNAAVSQVFGIGPVSYGPPQDTFHDEAPRAAAKGGFQ